MPVPGHVYPAPSPQHRQQDQGVIWVQEAQAFALGSWWPEGERSVTESRCICFKTSSIITKCNILKDLKIPLEITKNCLILNYDGYRHASLWFFKEHTDYTSHWLFLTRTYHYGKRGEGVLFLEYQHLKVECVIQENLQFTKAYSQIFFNPPYYVQNTILNINSRSKYKRIMNYSLK